MKRRNASTLKHGACPRLKHIEASLIVLAGGFTLIELLIVMFIISIVSSVTLLTISFNDKKKLETFSKDLVQLISLSEEQAILKPCVLGIIFHEHDLEWLQLEKRIDKNKKIQFMWRPLSDGVLSKYPIPNNVTLKVTVSGMKEQKSSKQASPQIVIANNGDFTPFSIYIGKRGARPSYIVVGTIDGAVTYSAYK